MIKKKYHLRPTTSNTGPGKESGWKTMKHTGKAVDVTITFIEITSLFVFMTVHRKRRRRGISLSVLRDLNNGISC